MKTIINASVLIMIFLLTAAFLSDDTIPKGWAKAGNNVTSFRVGVDSKVSNHGAKSAYIESIDENHKGFCTLMQTFMDESLNNKRVKLTCYVKTEGKADTVAVWVRIDDFDKKVMADFDNMDKRRIMGVNNWKKCEIVFDVPPSKGVINYGVLLYGIGKVWVDNFTLTVVDKSTPKTAVFNNSPLPPNSMMWPGKRINLDFEE